MVIGGLAGRLIGNCSEWKKPGLVRNLAYKRGARLPLGDEPVNASFKTSPGCLLE